ncbi:MAG TPA: beta-propeller fold lactonase family protein [Edaphobacter sp.]|nr:beta-propeller fold lactonase family protein [Edaphobacter sp.]
MLGALAVMLAVLTGCDNFFVPVKPVPPPSSSGDYAYVANYTTSTVSGFSLSAGTLKSVPNSPLGLGYQPVAMAVTPNNKYLYVAAPGTINVYTINSDGSLTAPSGGAGVAVANVVSMDISPDGKWLLALDSTPLAATVDQFQINSSTGGLAPASPVSYAIPNVTIVPKMLRIAPNGALVFAALGTGGDLVFSFDTTSGALITEQQLNVGGSTSDNGLAVDSTSTNLYIARSGNGGGVAVYSIGASGKLNAVKGSPFDSGGQAYSIAFDHTGKYVYAANRQNGTIYGYSIGIGPTLTALDGSPYASGQQVTSLGADNSGKYLVAASFAGKPDVSLYGFDTTTAGKLVQADSSSPGRNPSGAIAVALTH